MQQASECVLDKSIPIMILNHLWLKEEIQIGTMEN